MNSKLFKQGFFIILTACLLSLWHLSFAGRLYLDPELLTNVEQEHGPEAKQRLEAWQKLVNENLGESELEKLRVVNLFFNKIKYSPDSDEWGSRDYWATPVELLAKNAGDCEDYALAKYYTLRKLGIPTNKLRLTYTKSKTLNQAHMVLTYYENPAEEPMILDNTRQYILYASERPDLIPVYSFNGDGLWKTQSMVKKSDSKFVGSSSRMRLWADWESRLAKEGIK